MAIQGSHESSPARPEPGRGPQLTFALPRPRTRLNMTGFAEPDAMESTLTLILAGGKGKRLLPLTARRGKPAVPFANRKLIDYTLANCLRSRLRDIVVLTQHHEESVRTHVESTWTERLPGLRVLSSREVGRTYRGTADAVRAALARLADGRRVLVLAGDHVYGMDYRRLATDHRALGADMTIGMVPVPIDAGPRLGCIELDAQGLVRSFREKPTAPPSIPGRHGFTLASMGIYLFRRSVLETYLYEHPTADDFGHDVIPGMVDDGARIAGHHFAVDGEPCYWRDISDVDAYHAAHMDLLRGTFDDGDSWIGPRSVVAGGTLDRCVLGRAVQIGPHAELSETILLDDVVVGPGAHLKRVVVEEGVHIPPSAIIGFDPESDRVWGTVTPYGITVVTQSAQLPKERAGRLTPPAPFVSYDS